MVYRVAEGSLVLASELQWQDQSINVLLPQDAGVQGANLVIARDRLPAGVTFHDYVIQQRQAFASQLAGFELIANTAIAIDDREAHFLELGWKSDGKPIHQVMAMVLCDSSAVLNFTGSIPGGRDEETRSALLTAITSFTFAA